MRDGRSIDISWVPLNGVAGYRVEVGHAPGQTSFSATTAGTSITFDSSDMPSAAYYIRVRAMVNGVPGNASNEEAVAGSSVPRLDTMTDAARDCTGFPGAPRQFVATANGTAVQLSWQPGSTSASSYQLQVGSSPGLANLMLVALPGGQYGLGATAAHGVYALRLVSVNECGPSTWGGETVLTVGTSSGGTHTAAPGMPASLTQEVNGTTVTLVWTAPLSGEPATRYLIEAVTPFGPFSYDTASPATSFTNVNTPPGEYVVTVRAGNSAGFGPPSSPVTIVIH
jgi:hypothetical protein